MVGSEARAKVSRWPALRRPDGSRSALTAARESGAIERGIETLPAAEGAGTFLVEAERYGRDEREYVLAVATAAS